MKKIILSYILLFLAPVTFATELIPKTPHINAKAYILIDNSNGSVIAQKDSDKKLPPASLTKLMTSYIASYQLQQGILQLQDDVHVSHKAWKAQGSRMFIEVNKQIKLTDILKGIIIQSGNDASIALAEHIATTEDEFALLMNKFATTLGMQNTSFKNATGLPQQGHYTTAQDLAILASHIISEVPALYALYAQKSYTYNNIKQFNRNKLLWIDKSVDSLKTGHTAESGYSMVSSAKRDKTRLIAVVIGAKSDKDRITDSKKLLNYGFRYFETYKAFNKDETIQTVNIFGSHQDTLALVVQDAAEITLMRGKKKNIKTIVTVDKYITAPIKKGDKYGEITISLDNNNLATIPLVAATSVEAGNFLITIWHKLLLMFYKLFDINPNPST
jgi:serine-type D-Ala-D-Ala carboxypeptidase (penicillin-binding protein 5/6)